MNGYGWEPAEHQLRLLGWPQSGSGELVNAEKGATQQGGEDQRIQQKRSATKRPAVHSPPQRLGPSSQWESARFFQPFFFCRLGMPLASHPLLLCSHVPVMISCTFSLELTSFDAPRPGSDC